MQPLTTYDFVLNIFVVVIMPLLIVANLKGWGSQAPLNVYLWREQPEPDAGLAWSSSGC